MASLALFHGLQPALVGAALQQGHAGIAVFSEARPDPPLLPTFGVRDEAIRDRLAKDLLEG